MDVEADTGNIDPGLIESAITPRTKAIIPVDALGQPALLDLIREVTDRHGLVVIEDSCESLGSEYKGRKCGSPAYAHAAAFAFYYGLACQTWRRSLCFRLFRDSLVLLSTCRERIG